MNPRPPRSDDPGLDTGRRPDAPDGRDPAGSEDMGQTFRDVRAFQAGDREALGRLYERYYDRVLSYVRIRMGPGLRARAEPDDLVQRTFEVALARLDGFEMREPGAMIHWLGRIAENQISDLNKYWQAEKRSAAQERGLHAFRPDASASWSSIALADSGTQPPDRLMNEELREILESCIAELSPDHQQVLLLRMVAGASLEYTAEAMGRQTPQAVAMLHARARLKLMETLRRRLGSV